MLSHLRKDIHQLADPKKSAFLARFFKTGKDQYAAGDIFLGLTVPQSRIIVRKYRDLPLTEVLQLLKSKFHEERLIALLIMVYQFDHSDEKVKKNMYDAYLANTKYINNWDLVDLSAEYIVGEYLKEKDRSILVQLARSKDLWEKRISIIATFAFIRNGESKTTFAIADILLNDKHDLIHKAVGWMLREVGKRVSEKEEEAFLKPRYKSMPRTMLRYAIERFSEEKRKKYLEGMI